MNKYFAGAYPTFQRSRRYPFLPLPHPNQISFYVYKWLLSSHCVITGSRRLHLLANHVHANRSALCFQKKKIANYEYIRMQWFSGVIMLAGEHLCFVCERVFPVRQI